MFQILTCTHCSDSKETERYGGPHSYCNVSDLACYAIVQRRQELARPFSTSKTFGFTTLMGVPAA